MPRAARFAKTLGKPWPQPRGGAGARPYFMARVMKILIVEDEPVLREILADMFSTGDHEVKAVATGASGLAALERWPPTSSSRTWDCPERTGRRWRRRRSSCSLGRGSC